MKLAYSIPNLDELSLEDLDRYLGILSAIGYDGAETSVCYGDKVDGEAVKKLLEKHNIKLSGLRSGAIYDKAGLRFTSPDPEIRRKAVDTLKKLIDLAGFFGCDILLGRIQGLLEPGEDLAQAKKYIVDCLRESSEYAGKYGIYIHYEPINRFEMNYNHTTKEMIEFTKYINSGINHEVRLLMDVFHMMLEDFSIPGAFVRSRELIGHVHFADSTRDQTRGVPGSGAMNFKEYIDVLDAMGYNGWIAMEVGLQDPDYEWGAKTSFNYISTLIELCKRAQ